MFTPASRPQAAKLTSYSLLLHRQERRCSHRHRGRRPRNSRPVPSYCTDLARDGETPAGHSPGAATLRPLPSRLATAEARTPNRRHIAGQAGATLRPHKGDQLYALSLGCAQRCRPEVGVPSCPRASSPSATRGDRRSPTLTASDSGSAYSQPPSCRRAGQRHPYRENPNRYAAETRRLRPGCGTTAGNIA